MKNLYILLIFALSFFACEIDTCSDLGKVKVESLEIYRFTAKEDLGNIKSIYDLNVYIGQYRYKSDEADYWQLPEETYNKRSGDCEDLALLYMYILKNYLGISSSMIVISDSRMTVDHVIVLLNEREILVDATNLFSWKLDNYNVTRPTWSIKYVISYGEALWMTVNYHVKVGQYYY